MDATITTMPTKANTETLDELAGNILAIIRDKNVSDFLATLATNKKMAEQMSSITDDDGSVHNIARYSKLAGWVDNTYVSIDRHLVGKTLLCAIQFYASLRDRPAISRSEMNSAQAKTVRFQLAVSKLEREVRVLEEKAKDDGSLYASLEEKRAELAKATTSHAEHLKETGEQTIRKIEVARFPERIRAAKKGLLILTNSGNVPVSDAHDSKEEIFDDVNLSTVSGDQLWLKMMELRNPALYKQELEDRERRIRAAAEEKDLQRRERYGQHQQGTQRSHVSTFDKVIADSAKESITKFRSSAADSKDLDLAIGILRKGGKIPLSLQKFTVTARYLCENPSADVSCSVSTPATPSASKAAIPSVDQAELEKVRALKAAGKFIPPPLRKKYEGMF